MNRYAEIRNIHRTLQISQIPYTEKCFEKIDPIQQQINSKNFAKVNFMRYIRIIMINKNNR